MKRVNGNTLEIFGDEMAAAVGPSPRESVVVEHPRHDVVHARRLDKLLALEVIIVRHVQPESFVQPIISFKSLSRKKKSINQSI